MNAPRICIAGLDSDTGVHIRPTTPRDDLITRELLRENGGPLTFGTEVELGEVYPAGSPPEMEDHQFETEALRHVRDLSGDEFLELLEQAQSENLEDAFGPALTRRTPWKYAVDAGEGTASLAVVRCQSAPSLDIDTTFGPKLQLTWRDPEPQTYLPVTDLRFYDADQKTIKEQVVTDVAVRLGMGVGCLVMLGLARPWLRPGDDAERHWLQLNGLVLEDSPVGDLP